MIFDNGTRNEYTATNLQTVFQYTFEIVASGDIVVQQNGSTIAEGTDYTVSSVGNDNGGNITLTVGATTGDNILIFRDMPFERLTDFQNQGDFLASDINGDQDRIWLAIQQNETNINLINGSILDTNTLTSFLKTTTTGLNTSSIVEFDGFLKNGDGGKATWQHNGVTGETASQSPAQLGDALLNDASGNQWALVITETVNIKVLGDVFDTALIAAVNGLAGKAQIIISGSFATSGSSFTSINGIDIKFVGAGLLTLNNSSNARILLFTTCTDVVIRKPAIEGNRLNQAVTGGGSGLSGIEFEACTTVKVIGGQINNCAGSGVRGRNSSGVKVRKVGVKNNGYRQIYIAPSTTSGINSDDIEVSRCVGDWSTMSPSSLTSEPIISVTNNGVSLYTNVSVLDNKVKQHSDNVTNSVCIEAGNVTNNLVMSLNKTENGDLGVSWFGCHNFAVSNNPVKTGGLIGIEIANSNTNGTVSNNPIDGLGTLTQAMAINGLLGVVSDVTVSGNVGTNCVNGITATTDAIGNQHGPITLTGNQMKVTTGRPVRLKWCSEINSSGNTWDGNNSSSSMFQMTECVGRFSISDSFKNVSNIAIEIASSVAIAIDEGTVNGCNFADTDFLPLTNFVRNNLFAGSTVGSVVVSGNSRGPSFSDWFNNIISDLNVTGTPEGAVAAGIGSRATRTDGGAGTVLYIKETGTGNTGWVGK